MLGKYINERNGLMLTVNELFSGIGAQAKALERLNVPHRIVCTSDIDKDAILSYASVHCGLLEKYKDFIENTNITNDLLIKMRDELLEKGININPKNKNKLPLYYLAVRLSNNIGDISKVSELPYVDMWTYSFPCTDISIAGRRGV